MMYLCFFWTLIFGTIYCSEDQMSPYVAPGDHFLRMVVPAVLVDEIQSEKIQAAIDVLLQVARGERGGTEKSVAVGLAAPQIGIPLRIILVDIGVDIDRRNLGQLTAYINPEIVSVSKDLVYGREGCFSVDERVAGVVSRSSVIHIKAYDRSGNEVYQEFSGMTARIFQHEIDHLDGIRFPDRVGEDGVLHWVEENQYPEYRKNWQNWPNSCPWSIWQEMKDGIPYSLKDVY